MATLAFGVAGAFIGSFFGPLGTAIGWSVGAALGGALFPGKGQDGPRLTDLKLQTSAYGVAIPIHWGKVRAAGASVIWQTDLVEHKHTSGGKGGQRQTTYSYSASFAIGLCQTTYIDSTGALVNTPIIGISRIWADQRLIWKDGARAGSSTPLPITIYLGTEDQEPDPTMEADKGVGNVPAHRGMAYVVFTDLELDEFYNRIPNLTFEIIANGGPVTLERYATFDVDPNLHGDHSAYSYPFVLNGQAIDEDGNLISYQYRRTGDYGPEPTDHGEYSFGWTVRTLKGQAVSDGYTPISNPFPGFGSFGIGAYSCAIYGGMSGNVAYGTAGCSGVWPGDPDGTVFKSHVVSGWLVNGAIAAVPDPYALAQMADGDGFDMGINGAPILVGDYLYAAGTYKDGNGHDDSAYAGDQFLRRYPITERGPSLAADRTFRLVGADPSSVDIVLGDDGYIYAMCSHAEPPDTPAGFNYLYKLDKSLNLIRAWPSGFSALHFTPGFSSFAVIANGKYILGMSDRGGPYTSTPAAYLYGINDDDTFTFIDYVTVAGDPPDEGPTTPLIPLGDGFAAGKDGIFHIGGGEGVSLAYIVADVSARVALDADEYDVSDLPDTVRGYTVGQQMPARSAIETLQQGFFFDPVESDAAMKFIKRGHPSVATIPDDDLGAREQGEDLAPLLSTTRVDEAQLPRAIYVKYFNVGADYQDGTQLWQREAKDSGLETTANLAIVFNDDEAKKVADTLGVNAWVERNKYSFTTSRKWDYLEPSDVLVAHGREMRIVSKDNVANGLVKWDGLGTGQFVFVQAPVSAAPHGFVPPVVTELDRTALLLLDLPLIHDSDFPNGFYAGLTGMYGGDARKWGGAALLKSSDGGVNYTQIGSVTTPHALGAATTPLGDFTGGNIFDETNSITVTLDLGGAELTSSNTMGVLNGANMASLGDEIIQFRTATLTAAATYELSGLLRGRRGTEWAIGAHVYGERFALLPLLNTEGAFSELRQERLYKGITQGATEDSEDAQAFTNNGVALKCYAPDHLDGGRNAAGDLTLNWVRRTRINGVWMDGIDSPLSEASESYVVTVYTTSSYATIKTAWLVSAAQTTVYTAASQTSDFGSPQATVYWSVAQIGAIGQGQKAYAAT